MAVQGPLHIFRAFVIILRALSPLEKPTATNKLILFCLVQMIIMRSSLNCSAFVLAFCYPISHFRNKLVFFYFWLQFFLFGLNYLVKDTIEVSGYQGTQYSSSYGRLFKVPEPLVDILGLWTLDINISRCLSASF